jgi:hypothetical protein
VKSTLCQRLGGKPAVDAAVDLFYYKVLKDEKGSSSWSMIGLCPGID